MRDKLKVDEHCILVGHSTGSEAILRHVRLYSTHSYSTRCLVDEFETGISNLTRSLGRSLSRRIIPISAMNPSVRLVISIARGTGLLYAPTLHC
jgi:pimeloyl-ACP methyl ester carboxylesterase